MEYENLTRREFVKWSFGLFVVSIRARRGGFLHQLEEVAAWIASDCRETAAAFLPRDQYLQTRPKLTDEFFLEDNTNGGMLRSQDAELMLNDSAYLVLSRCDGHMTVKELCQALFARFGTAPEETENDLVSFLDCLYRLDMMLFSLRYRLDEQYEIETPGSSIWETIPA